MAELVGGVMFNTRGWIALGLLSALALPAMGQSFRVQCPTNTVTHPNPANNNLEPAYSGPTYPTPATASTNPTDYTTGKTGPVNGAIKCQQISGGDGYATMGDGTQTYLFSFGPLSGLGHIGQGHPSAYVNPAFETRGRLQRRGGLGLQRRQRRQHSQYQRDGNHRDSGR